MASSALMLGMGAPGWLGVAIGSALIAGAAIVIWQLSSREGWNAEHCLALAGGALLSYCWVGFG